MKKLHLIQSLSLISVVLVCLAFVPAGNAQGIFRRWEVTEMQPNIPNGGRANTFAVHPSDVNKIYVTSESGGLFRSTNRGVTWRHVDELPCFRTMSVTYLAANPDIVLVTTLDDFKASGGGGIWRSIDGGFSWTMSTVTIPPAVATGRLSGYEISVAPDTGHIYVGSSFGVLKSIDQGGSWTFHDVFGGNNVYSVVALRDGRIIAGGPAGVRRSETGGTSWLSPATSPGAVYDLHALGRSPLLSNQAFLANGNTELFHTEDAGNNWTQVTSAPGGGGGCGGITFARAANRSFRAGFRVTRRMDLFFGNRCSVSRLRVTRNTLGSFDFSGAWQSLSIDHGDTRDIAFDNATNANPIFLGTDGGLHKTTDGGNTWTFTGGGPAGYNALQITEVQGQLIQDIGRFDFYFGTQDNDVWSSGTNGASWIKGTCCEGFFIEAQKRVTTAADSKVTTVACGACVNLVSDALFTNVGGWTNPAGDVAGNPMILRQSQHLQGVNDSGGFANGLAFTGNLGGMWQQYASFPEGRRDIPKLGRLGTASIRRRSTVVYQAYRAPGWAPGGFEINWLMRVNKSPLNPTATVVYPAMNNFGGLGINPTMFAWYQVFAVDPGNYLHVIAPDVVNQKMMETRDGGQNWTEIPGLTNLVTDGGRLIFSSNIFPLVSAISFSPQDPNIVAIGTSEGGVYLSSDNGANWFRVANSEGVTYTTGFAWKNASDVVISTYGRGLWRLKYVLRIPRPDFEIYCLAPCFELVWPWEREIDPAELRTFDRGLLVFEGRVMGATIANRVIKEVFVSEGSSVVFAGDDNQALDIKITYTNKQVGFRGSRYSPKGTKGNELMKGLVFDKENRLTGAVFGDKPAMMYQEKDLDDQDGNTKSPTTGKPYIQLVTKRFEGAPVALPNEVIPISIGNLKRTADIVIYVDNKPVTKFRTDEKGWLRVEVRAPQEFGLHSLTIRDANDEKTVIDGTMFLVKHEDNFKRAQQAPK